MDLTTVAGIAKYGIYHEAVHGKITEPIPLIWNTLSKLLIDMLLIGLNSVLLLFLS